MHAASSWFQFKFVKSVSVANLKRERERRREREVGRNEGGRESEREKRGERERGWLQCNVVSPFENSS